MKKACILAVAVLVAAPVLLAQTFSDQGTYSTTTQKIAIGSTAVPTRQLEVFGDSSFAGQILFTQHAGPRGRVYMQVARWLGMSLNTVYGANGWGLDDPAAAGWFMKLDVRPGFDQYALYRVPPGATDQRDDATPMLSVLASGRVGIGTISPTHKLAVHIADNGDGLAVIGAASPGVRLLTGATAGANDRNWGIFANYASSGDLALVPSSASTTAPWGTTAALVLQSNGHARVNTVNGQGAAVAAPQTPGVMLLNTATTAALRNWGMFSNYGNAGDLAFVRSTSATAAPYGGAVTMTLSAAGFVGIGTATPVKPLHVAGDIQVDGNINAKFQDVAEWVPTTTPDMPAATVVVVSDGARNHVSRSSRAYDTAVAGVVSDRPGLLLGEADTSKTRIATTGRVRVCVDARTMPVRPGDLLVTSDVPGCAMKSEPMRIGGRSFHQPGTLIGKALEPLDGKVGEVLVLLSLQ